MPKAHFDIYRAQVFELAKTLVIKSLATAFTINEELKLMGHPVNEEDFRSWKYYRNLAGQYHAYDTVMTVVSLDTLQTIEFTVENLRIHRATADAYAFGSRYYNELVERFPTQEPLINGILNPVDMTRAIQAEDGQILWHQPRLVESNEDNLIPKLQAYIDGVYARWNVSAYQMTDELYVPAFLAMLYNFLPIAIMNIRNANVHTRYAHSFHIREFLTSHGKLDVFLDYLTKSQMLWLYRNIRYIHRNAGKQETLDWLIDNILTPRLIPLSEWDAVHNLANMPETLYPAVEFARTAKNLGYHQAGADTKTVEDMLDDEQPEARGNAHAQPEAEVEIRRQLETSIRNEYRTKVLESAMLDLSGSGPFSFADFLLNHWMYLSHNDRYNSFVTFDDPRTGEATTVSTKDAFTIFLYALNRQHGVTLTQVPTLEAKLVRKLPMPTRATIRAITDAQYLPEPVLEALYRDIPNVGRHISVAGFRESMQACFNALLRQRFVWAQQEHYQIRGQAEIAGLHFYHHVPVDLSQGTDTYAEWFAERNMPYLTYTEFECETLARSILTQATGESLDDVKSQREMQAALIRLMARLSSYTVQFLRQINESTIRWVDWNPPKIGDIDAELSAHVFANTITVSARKLIAESLSLQQLSIYDAGVDYRVYGRSASAVTTNISSSITPNHIPHRQYRMLQPHVHVRGVTEVVEDFEADTPVRESNHYKPVEYLELEDAFLTRETALYTLTDQDRQRLEIRWLAYSQNPRPIEPGQS